MMALLHLLEFLESHLHRSPPHSFLLLYSDFSFHILFLKSGCSCVYVCLKHAAPEPRSSAFGADHQDHEGLMMLLLHQVSVCSQGQKQYAVNCTMASSGWYAACKRDVIGYRFTGHSAKIACLVASNANSDSFETGREEPRVTGVCLAEEIFSLLSDLPPLLLPRDWSDRVALPRCLIV